MGKTAAAQYLTKCLVATMLLAGLRLAQAQTESVFFDFTTQDQGAQPYAGLIADKKGNLYGQTNQGGIYNGGTVFKVSQAGTEKVLHSFDPNGGDGGGPYGSLVMDSKGNLYGTTVGGGTRIPPVGTVFKLSPGGTETVLYSFGASSATDGYEPRGALILDAEGNLYGTTELGGANGGGTVFKLSPSGTETILYNFCAEPSCADGNSPLGSLIMDKRGNLYGTTYNGGAHDQGTVFKLGASGSYKVLHSFDSQSGDGAYPYYVDLIQDKSGNLYGTTSGGGTAGGGTVFKITTGGTEAVVYSFGSQSGDGSGPCGSLAMDASGNLYGTTNGGGAGKRGTVFEITPTHKESVLYSFQGDNDGEYPYAGPTIYGGNLYGTTEAGGGDFGGGIVFKLIP